MLPVDADELGPGDSCKLQGAETGDVAAKIGTGRRIAFGKGLGWAARGSGPDLEMVGREGWRLLVGYWGGRELPNKIPWRDRWPGSCCVCGTGQLHRPFIRFCTKSTEEPVVG